MFKQIFLIIAISFSLGTVRQFFPDGISWKNTWPTENSTAHEAFKLLAKENDPRFVGVTEAKHIQENKTGIFIDARAHDLYKEGHIPGARSLPFYALDEYSDAALGDLEAEQLLVIYCEGVGCELSFFLGRELQEAGYENVGIFYGGYPEWIEAGLKIEK